MGRNVAFLSPGQGSAHPKDLQPPGMQSSSPLASTAQGLPSQLLLPAPSIPHPGGSRSAFSLLSFLPTSVIGLLQVRPPGPQCTCSYTHMLTHIHMFTHACSDIFYRLTNVHNHTYIHVPIQPHTLPSLTCMFAYTHTHLVSHTQAHTLAHPFTQAHTLTHAHVLARTCNTCACALSHMHMLIDRLTASYALPEPPYLGLRCRHRGFLSWLLSGFINQFSGIKCPLLVLLGNEN